MSGPMQLRGGMLVPALTGGLSTSEASPVPASLYRDPSDDDVDDEDYEVTAPPIVQHTATPAKRRPRAEPVNVVKLARERLRTVEVELRHMKKLEAERDELRRLLAAAKSKPRAVVRELPKRSA